ncbi:MAG: methyltransferase domain-containing protein [Cytophagaceae bacterium]|nr:methyltransferase domain-containing protein [Cytophagaceae bacterium]MDW8456826.1 methyltransferase domain-containing protein [Cytophagaceae bacterium]
MKNRQSILHKNLIEATVLALDQIMLKNQYADKVLEKILKSNRKWGARDRAFIAETTYDIVRWWRLLYEVLELRDVKACHLYSIAGIYLQMNGFKLPSWPEFKDIVEVNIASKISALNTQRKIRESIPDWLDEWAEQQLGNKWNTELQALNGEAHVVLRVNTLKIKRDELVSKLGEEQIKAFPLNEYPDAVQLNERRNIFQSNCFKEGYFEIQDASSQLVAPALKLEPGMRLIDACAGAGGKTLHAACLMHNKGKIIALDTEEWKLKNLQHRARRAGTSIVETRLIESSKTIKRLYHSADRLLLDVPCSGIGVLKRNPDAKWKLSPDFIARVQQMQQYILNNYHNMLKPGGVMVYSTCSIMASENQHQIRNFLTQQKNNFELLNETTIFPSESGYDGFYIATLKKLCDG